MRHSVGSTAVDKPTIVVHVVCSPNKKVVARNLTTTSMECLANQGTAGRDTSNASEPAKKLSQKGIRPARLGT